MFVRRLRLTNLRCRHELEVELGEGLNIIVGPNGAGKTTVLEAATLVLLGSPFRTTNVRDVISRDRDHLRVEAELVESGSGGERPLFLIGGSVGAARGTPVILAAAGFGRDGERRFTADGAPLNDADRWKELLPVRTFAPDDLRLIKGSPRRRRDYLDSLAGRSYPEYSGTARRYDEALSQRNYLLRASRGLFRDDEFEPWEALLAKTGLLISRWRAASLGSFVSAFQRTHEELTGEPAENLRLVYRTNVAELDEAVYRARLAESRGADQQRTYTHLGPHRDDLRLLRGGLDMRECASQGEQRTALLALVLAEWEQLLAGPAQPLLLLDDVMSELDPSRRRRLVSFIRRDAQTLITTTDLRYFSPEELQSARVVDLGPGDCGQPPAAPDRATASDSEREAGGESP
jgi:DNA replication and repair protein RecF